MIDPAVALKACQEVLLKVQLQNRDGSEPQDPPEQSRSLRDTLSIREEDEDAGAAGRPAPASSSKQSWLLRLFESKLFDVSMAISYLYKSKEPGVHAYIGNRLFTFPDADVDFYLPQLLSMYVHMDTEVGDAIRPYLVSAGGRRPPPSAVPRRLCPECFFFCVGLNLCALLFSGVSLCFLQVTESEWLLLPH